MVPGGKKKVYILKQRLDHVSVPIEKELVGNERLKGR